MQLTFNGNEYFPDQEILVDGAVINTNFAIDYPSLIKSISKDEELFILTCGCGDVSCAGLHEDIWVSHSSSTVTWRVINPKPVRMFQFDAAQYFIAIVQFFRAANAINGDTDESAPGSIGHLGFDPIRFAACLRELEAFGKESGLTEEARLRELY
jgi:hypothetical protein